jgi:hypothetical protein
VWIDAAEAMAPALMDAGMYYPGYYAADAFDPDGYSFEVVHKR